LNDVERHVVVAVVVVVPTAVGEAVAVVGRAPELPGVDVGRRGDLRDRAVLLLRLVALLRGCAGRLARVSIAAKSICDDN